MNEEYIDTEEISNFLFQYLVKQGFCLKDEELEVLADAFFEFLIKKGVIEEEE